jgi:hypothetical protein
MHWLVGEVRAPTWRRGYGWRRCFWCSCGGIRAFSPWESPMLAHRRGSRPAARCACQPAGRPSHHPCVRRGTVRCCVRCGAGEKVKKKKEQRPTSGSHTSAREEKKGLRLLGCLVKGLDGPAGLQLLLRLGRRVSVKEVPARVSS